MPSEVDDVLDFLCGKTAEKPSLIINAADADKQNSATLAQKIYESRRAKLEERFGDTPADEKTQAALKKILDAKGLQVNRPLNYVTKREAANLLGYLKEPEKYHESSLLKPFEPPRENDIENARRLMQHKGIIIAI